MSSEQDSEFVTPRELADELGGNARTIRAWLRSVEMRPEFKKNSPWLLTTAEAEFVRHQFS